MGANESLQPPGTIEHGTTRWGRWLKVRRIRIALWIAVLEGIIVAVSPDFTKWTVIAIAVPILAIYALWGRNAKSDTTYQVAWIAGASQSLAVVIVILGVLLSWLPLVLAAIFAGVALLFLYHDRG
jgi:hypothetical protein